MTTRLPSHRHLQHSEVKILDAKAGRVLAVLSTETKDRDGDIIRQEFWDLDNFMKNPVMLDSHRYGSLEAVMGHWEGVEVKRKQLIGEGIYHLDSPNPGTQSLAAQGLDLAKRNLAVFSVGFIPDMSKAVELKDSDGFFPNFEFKGQELLETSQVSVPSNPDAAQRMKGLHPLLDEMIEEKMITITIDDEGSPAPTLDDDLKAIVEQFIKSIGLRMDDLEEALVPLKGLLHTHPGGPEPEIDTNGTKRKIDFVELFREAREEAING